MCYYYRDITSLENKMENTDEKQNVEREGIGNIRLVGTKIEQDLMKGGFE